MSGHGVLELFHAPRVQFDLEHHQRDLVLQLLERRLVFSNPPLVTILKEKENEEEGEG